MKPYTDTQEEADVIADPYIQTLIDINERADADTETTLLLLAKMDPQKQWVVDAEFEAEGLHGGVGMHTKDAIRYRVTANNLRAINPEDTDAFLYDGLAQSQITAARGCAFALNDLMHRLVAYIERPVA